MLQMSFFFLVIIVLLAAILVYVFYLLNLQRLLNEISPGNRLVSPTNVWYMFIPLFSHVYGFILYPKICDSVKNEYESRGIPGEGDFGKGIGITIAILSVVGLLRFIPVLVTISAIINIVLFIVFWIKMSGYKNQLMNRSGAADGISSNPDLLD